MTVKEIMEEYLEGKADAISIIRALSGIALQVEAMDTLAVICMITRVEQGDLDKDLLRALVGLNIEGTLQ